jgi:hypothetical protein
LPVRDAVDSAAHLLDQPVPQPRRLERRDDRPRQPRRHRVTQTLWTAS